MPELSTASTAAGSRAGNRPLSQPSSKPPSASRPNTTNDQRLCEESIVLLLWVWKGCQRKSMSWELRLRAVFALQSLQTVPLSCGIEHHDSSLRSRRFRNSHWGWDRFSSREGDQNADRRWPEQP